MTITDYALRFSCNLEPTLVVDYGFMAEPKQMLLTLKELLNLTVSREKDLLDKKKLRIVVHQIPSVEIGEGMIKLFKELVDEKDLTFIQTVGSYPDSWGHNYYRLEVELKSLR